MISTKDLLMSRRTKSCIFSILVFLMPIGINNEVFHLVDNGFKFKEKAFVLKTEQSRQYNKETNMTYGAIYSLPNINDFNYMVNSKKSFIFSVTHNFSSINFETDPSRNYKNKYIYKTNDFINALSSYAYNTEKAIYNINFDDLTNNKEFNPTKYRYDYSNNLTTFYEEINLEGTGYNYDDRTQKVFLKDKNGVEHQYNIHKPRMVLGVVKEGKLLDYVTFSKNPEYFSTVGVYDYLNYYTYSSNVYVADSNPFLSDKTNYYTSNNLVCRSTNKKALGCLLNNNSNETMIINRVYYNQIIFNEKLKQEKNFMVYNYDSLNDYNAEYFKNYVQNNNYGGKIYVTDTVYYTYDRNELYKASGEVKKNTSYNTIQYIPIAQLTNSYKNIAFSSLPYYVFIDNNALVDYAIKYQYDLTFNDNKNYCFENNFNPYNLNVEYDKNIYQENDTKFINDFLDYYSKVDQKEGK